MADDPHLAYSQRRVGTVIKGKYRIERVVGAGGMAVVYAATSHIEKRVAIKVLHPEYAVQGDIQSRFWMEAVATNRVGHPGAVDILDCDTTEDGARFLVMELLDGASLEKLAEQVGGRLPLEAVLAIAAQALDVLGAAHDQGIVHRDIKPENLFLTTDGAVKVLDFGIARVRDGASANKTQGHLGTPVFMAPEQARCEHHAIDARTDVWALGATIYRLLTGRIVYEAESAQAVVIRAATQPAPSLRAAMPDAPPVVSALVDRATAADRAQRWESARAMGRAVRQTQMAVFGRIARPPCPSELLGAPPDPLAPTVAADPRWALRAASVTPVAHALEHATPASRRRGVRGAIVLGVVACAAALGLAVAARVKPSAATPVAPQASAAPFGPAITCGGEPRVPLDCAARSSADVGASAVAFHASADAVQQRALEAIDRQRRDLRDALVQLCEDYNKCVFDKATYASRSDDLHRRLAEVPTLLESVQVASTDRARRVALSDAYQRIVPEAARTELKLDFSALARRPGESSMTAAPSGATIPTGSQLAFAVTVSRSAYVYIFEKTAGGAIHSLFPDPAHITIDNPLSPGAPLRIPQGGAFFRIDDKDIGAEDVYLLASLKPIASVAQAAEQLRLGHRASPVLARVTSIDGNCARRGLSFEEESPSSSGCRATRGLTFESERAGAAAPSLAAITDAADDTIYTVYTFNHTHP
jgi:eukaryotic-like serine/threonine-protein kinase